MLYDITAMNGHGVGLSDPLPVIPRTSFSAENILERSHLQAALRDRISVISPELYVVAEEFGDFEQVNRRIDLLCIDRDCRLVVVEIKRTADGGHMELQALRYAAMVSTMTFAQLVRAHARYRASRERVDHAGSDARAALLSWIRHEEETDPVVERDVGIVLVSEDFSQEITSTVLWLNEFHGFDVRCVRLSPYKLDDRLLLDVQHVIPLPEASAYMVRVREKEAVERQTGAARNQDNTKFVVTTATGASQPLAKRWAMLRLVEAVVKAGVSMDRVREVLPDSKTLMVDGTIRDPDVLWSTIQEAHGNSDQNRQRWHLQDPIHVDGCTWVLHNNWGDKSREQFRSILDLTDAEISVTAEDDDPGA